MLGTTFSHGIIRSYVVAFGTLFNNISINRPSDTFGMSQNVRVPISYGPKERWMVRLTQDPNLDRDVSITLPRISYELMSTVYAPDRKLNTMQKVTLPSLVDSGKAMSGFSAVPYDFAFTLSIMARTNADASAIVEQILPYFTPEFTLTIKNMTAVGVDVDAPIILNSINKEDMWEGSFDERRAIIWTLDFTLKGLFYGPIKESKIIKRAYVDFFNATSSSLLTGNVNSIGTGLTLQQFQLPKKIASPIDNIYQGGKVTILAGPGSGDVRNIVSYDGTNRLVTVSTNFSETPNTLSSFSLEYLPPLAPASAFTEAEIAGSKIVARVTVEPGVDATNFLPTTDRTATLALEDISANMEYGYVTTIQSANSTGGISPIDLGFIDPFGNFGSGEVGGGM